MASIFMNNNGRLAVLRKGGLPALVQVENFDDSDQVLVNSMSVGFKSNLQIQPSLRKQIYVYSFGDQIGQLQLGGVAAADQLCEGGSGEDGIGFLTNFYLQNRASSYGQHVNVTLGSVNFASFLTGLSVRLAGQEVRLLQWTMSFAALPATGRQNGLGIFP